MLTHIWRYKSDINLSVLARDSYQWIGDKIIPQNPILLSEMVNTNPNQVMLLKFDNDQNPCAKDKITTVCNEWRDQGLSRDVHR